MITIKDLRKSFGETCACDIPSLEIERGEIIGLVGNNGAGKTTLFRLILDLLKADDGYVELNDIRVDQSEEWKHFTSAFIDNGFLIDFLTPEEYVSFVNKISGIREFDIDAIAKQYEHFTAGEVFGRKTLIRNLSAGNKQKVGIISTLITSPDIVILDEPFNFLDPTSQNILKRIIEDYNRDTGATIIISSHNLTHTVDISTRILLMEHGQIKQDITSIDELAIEGLNAYFDQR
ncbi:MAG: ABC transporter ATP-binding protein [Prevotella sp.]